MEELMIAAALTGLPFAAYGVNAIVRSSRRKKRLLALEQWAQQRGFTFDPRMEWAIPPELQHFEAFSLGMGRAMENRMRGESAGLAMHLLDLRIGTSHGHHRWTVASTILEVSSPKLHLPIFRIEPENVLHKVQEAMGAQDIDFESHGRFSDEYLLRGESEQEIRAVFTPPVLDWFERHLGLAVEGASDRFILHRIGKLLEADQLDTQLGLAREVHDLFDHGSPGRV